MLPKKNGHLLFSSIDQLGWLPKTPRKQKSHFYPDLCHPPPFCTQNPKSNRGTKPFSRIFSKDSCAIRLCSISSASSKPAQGLGLVRLGADPFYNWLTKGSFIGLQQEVLTPPVKKKNINAAGLSRIDDLIVTTFSLTSGEVRGWSISTSAQCLLCCLTIVTSSTVEKLSSLPLYHFCSLSVVACISCYWWRFAA